MVPFGCLGVLVVWELTGVLIPRGEQSPSPPTADSCCMVFHTAWLVGLGRKLIAKVTGSQRTCAWDGALGNREGSGICLLALVW